ncbi:MAG: DUF1905 domain-containing protein [Sphingobacteriales bacterium]|nr:MAG: DUF1905 domain-containing protein [Sphingobacteriales bacterium]
MSAKTYSFTAPLMRMEGKGAWYYVPYPGDVEKEFGTKGSVRILGTYNGVSMDRALIPRGDGTHHIILSLEMRKKAGLRLGNEVTIRFKLNEDPDALIIPPELEEAFELDPFSREVFDRQTPGYRRGIIYWLDSAKRAETREQRAAEILRRLSTGSPEFGGRKGK